LQLTREGALDLQDEVGVVAKAVRLPLDDLDLVVDAFEPAGVDRIAAVVQDTLRVSQQVAGEVGQRWNPALLGQGTPLVECFPGPRRILVVVVPDPLQLVLEDVNGVKALIWL
jgi:hypothetical protein